MSRPWSVSTPSKEEVNYTTEKRQTDQAASSTSNDRNDFVFRAGSRAARCQRLVRRGGIRKGRVGRRRVRIIGIRRRGIRIIGFEDNKPVTVGIVVMVGLAGVTLAD
jgi:hypothetical protein